MLKVRKNNKTWLTWLINVALHAIKVDDKDTSQLTFTCSNSIMKTLEKDVKYFQS